MQRNFLPSFRSFCLALLTLGTLALPAQPGASVFQKAPRAVDEALRKRVNEFYQTHVDGKTRKALELVAEESADIFFNAQKPKLQNFEIQQVNYGKTFQEAVVLILAEREVLIPLAGPQMLKVPMESYWKQIDQKWFWYVPPKDCNVTPFGCAPNAAAPTAGPKISSDEMARKIKAISEMNFESQFGFDRTNIDLTSTTREVELSFRNDMDGWIVLKMMQEFSDPEFELTGWEPQIKPQSTAKVIVRLKKGVKVAKSRSVQIPLFVQPFNRSAGLTVNLRPTA